MFPSYSPLFTLGLLADPSSSSSSSSTSASSSSPSSPSPATPFDGASAIYFTLQPGKRDSVELRSFLYLDLADNNWRAPSHKRKFSLLSKSTSWTCSADAKSTYDFARTEKPMNVLPPTPVLRRASKESLRSIPSPKPAPSATLPELPTSPISPISPASLSVPSTSSTRKRPASALGGLLSPAAHVPRPLSLRSESISSHDRRMSRMDALACLEGRSSVPNRRNNFMSFSDDEDEKSPCKSMTLSSTPAVHVEDLSGFADVEDELDPVLSRKPVSAPSARPARPARKRRSTIDSWFPLKSFIDLKDDDLSSWNWRSFIEIGGVA